MESDPKKNHPLLVAFFQGISGFKLCSRKKDMPMSDLLGHPKSGSLCRGKLRFVKSTYRRHSIGYSVRLVRSVL